MRKRAPRPEPAKSSNRRTQPQRTAKTRMQILQAAADVFGRLGFAATRVEDILAQSGVSRPTFYRFFDSKEAVFDALDEMASLNLLQMVNAAVELEEDSGRKLLKGIEAFLRWLSVTGPLAQVLQQESMRPESRLAPRRESTHRLLVELFSYETERLRGERYDPLVFSSLLSAVEHTGYMLLRQTPRLTEKQIERGMRVVMRIVTGTLSVGDYPLPPIPAAPKRD